MVSTEAYVVHQGNGGFHLETVHYNGIGKHELLIETVAVSVCHTDVKAQQGGFMLKPPMIPGHESSGIVKEVGSDVTSFKPGDSVILSFAPCWQCKHCLSGRAPYCLKLMDLNFSGTRLDGSRPVTDKDGKALNSHFFGQSSMSRLVLAHENGAVKVEASREELVLFASLGCGIQTGAGTILNVLKPPVQSSIAIFGAGAVGLSACFMARLSSPSHLILIDVSSEKLSNLPPNLGTTHVINPTTLPPSEQSPGGQDQSPIVAKLLEITDGLGVDYVIDAVGLPQVLQDGHKAMAKCGTLVTLGGIMQPANISINDHLVKGGTYRGTHQGDSVPKLFIPKMIELWRQGKFPFDSMLTFYPFEELEKALADVHAGRVVKPVLTF